MENYLNFKNIFSGLLICLWIYVSCLKADAAEIATRNGEKIEPAGFTTQQTIEANDRKIYLLEQKNDERKIFKNVAATLYNDEGLFYLRLDQTTSAYWKRLHPDESGSWNLDQDVVVDYKYDRTDPNITYIETLFTTFEAGQDKGDSNSRWNNFYQFLAAEYGRQSSENKFGISLLDSHSEKEKSEPKAKSDFDDQNASQPLRHLDFGKFTSKEISLKPLEIILRFKNKSNSDDKEKDLRFFQDLYLQESKLNQSGFTEDYFYQKFSGNKSDSAENPHSEAMLDALKAIFGLDMQAIKQYLNEFQKLTEAITHQELVNLRPFYEALALLLKNEAGVEVPAQPTLENEVSSEELEWRKELDRLAYAILIGENTALNGPDKTKIVSFRSRYRELFKNHVLPVKARYNQRIQDSLSEFLKQLKEMLTNKTTQVVIKTTKDSTEFVVDVSADSKN